MHSAGFDTLVQSFGTGSRRDGLRLLMGAALGGILTGLHDADTAAKRRRRRRKKKCKPNCKGKECGRDGCGGSCGKCLGDPDCQYCVAGRCFLEPNGWQCTDTDLHCEWGVCTVCGDYAQPCCGDSCAATDTPHLCCDRGFCVGC